MIVKNLETRKEKLRENYMRCMTLNKLDEKGNTKVEIDNLVYGYKVGRNDWIYLTELPEEWSIVDYGRDIGKKSLKSIIIPPEFDILCCFNFYARNVDLGNILYMVNDREGSIDDVWQGLSYANTVKAKKLILSKLLDKNFKPKKSIFLGGIQITYRRYVQIFPKVKIDDAEQDLLFIHLHSLLELPNLKYINKRLAAYNYDIFRNSPYFTVDNNLKPGDIGYDELIMGVDEQIKKEREYIISLKANRIYKYGYGREYWHENYKEYMMGIEFMNWLVKYDKKRDLVVVEKNDSYKKYPAWADAITDDIWSFRSGKKVELLTDDMKVK